MIVAQANLNNVHPDNRVWSEPGRLMSAGGMQFLNGGTVPAGPTSNGQLLTYRFLKTGRYLVLCMNRVHFLNDWMFGFVNVTDAAGQDDGSRRGSNFGVRPVSPFRRRDSRVPGLGLGFGVDFRGRWIPSLFMRARSVLGRRPRICAAPAAPSMRHPAP